MKTCKFMGEECKVDMSRKYDTGMKAIQLICKDGEPMCTATTNLPDLYPEYKEDPNVVFIKNYTENAGVAEALVEAKVIKAIKRIELPPWGAEVIVARIIES